MAVIDSQGVQCTISLALLPEAKLWDWVLVHAGFAISIIDEEQARETLALFDELKRYARES